MKASDNPFTSILLTEGTEPSAPAAGKQRLYIDSTSHKLKRTDSSGTDVTIEGSGGITTGTSFPGSPSDNDFYYRTDLDALFFYDSTATKWMTVADFTGSFDQPNLMPLTVTSTMGYLAPPDIGTYTDIYIKTAAYRTQATATQSPGNLWTLELFKDPSSGAGTSLGTVTTNGDAANTWAAHSIAVNALMGGFSSWFVLRTVATKSGTGGNLYLSGCVTFKLVV